MGWTCPTLTDTLLVGGTIQRGRDVSNAEGKANVFFRSSRFEAVRLVKESKRFAAQISRDLGVSVESLKYWVKQQEIEYKVDPNVKTKTEVV